jgi:two-component system OmpR family sensor kinase
VHEFRTPLTGITGLAALLEEPPVRRSAEAAEMISMIRNEAEDMSQLTDDILTSAGLETGNLEIRVESVDVAEAAKRTVTMFERRGVSVEVACEPGAVVGDELRVRQVLKNLVSNAVKYGGPNIAVGGGVEGGFYEVAVSDDGAGVPDEILSRLFDPFPHGGKGAPSQSVGLGLFIVRELVGAMNGSVDYRRVDDRSVFTVRLPLDEQTKAARSLTPTMSVGA